MTDSGEGHVRFRNPPAAETLQGVFFRPLPNFSCAHQGLLWARHFRSEFPHIEEKSCLEQADERFGEQVISAPTIRWKVSDRPDTPRLWARSEGGGHVLQIQRDAFLTNWLKQGANGEYRHYPDRRADFEAKLQVVQQFLIEEGLGKLEPISCLMTYVNHIEIESLDKESEVAEEVFTFWSNKTNAHWLPRADQLVINASYRIPENKGRLHLQVVPAVVVGKDRNRFVMRFELTARGQPEENTVEAALSWLDLGHDWIVRGFVDITQERWHGKGNWERFYE